MEADASTAVSSYITLAKGLTTPVKVNGKLLVRVFGTHQMKGYQWSVALSPFTKECVFVGDGSGTEPPFFIGDISFWSGSTSLATTIMPCYGGAIKSQQFSFDSNKYLSSWSSADKLGLPVFLVTWNDASHDKSSIFDIQGCEALTSQQVGKEKCQ